MEVQKCKICGGIPRIRFVDPYDGYMGNCGAFLVNCPNCKVTVSDKGEHKCLEKWNTIMGGEKSESDLRIDH